MCAERTCETCARRTTEGRCLQCGNWPAICGHNLSFKERIQKVHIDTGWMPNAGSIGGTMGDD